MKAFSGRAVFCADLAATAEAMDGSFGFSHARNDEGPHKAGLRRVVFARTCGYAPAPLCRRRLLFERLFRAGRAHAARRAATKAQGTVGMDMA
jgi:hypothetical protein